MLLAIVSTKLFIVVFGFVVFFYTGKFICKNFFPEDYLSYQANIYDYYYYVLVYGFCFWFVVICACFILFFSYEEAVRNYKIIMGKESES